MTITPVNKSDSALINDLGWNVGPIKKPDSTVKIIRICAPARGKLLNPPLYIAVTKNHEYKLKGIEVINPYWIQTINILKDSASVAKYGPEAKGGVVIITINDKEHPEVNKIIKDASRRSKMSS
jgi:hypothetical protein